MKLRPGIISTLGSGGGGGGGGGTTGAPTYNWQSTYRHSIGDLDNIMPNVAAQDGDVMLMFVENGGADAAIAPPSGGWSHVTLSPIADTTGGSTGQTRLSCFWKRFVAPGDASPNWDLVNDDDHASAVILGFRNVKTTGNPWDITSVGTAGAAINNPITVPGLTTTVANCLVVVGVSTSIEADSTAEFGVALPWTNASLVSITEVFDATDSAGDGTGIGVACGVKLTAGVVGSTTVSSVNAQRHAYITVALAPAS